MGLLNMERIRAGALRISILFFCLSALLSVVAVLFGSSGFTGKVLGTTVTITIAGVCCLSCGAFGQRTGRNVAAGTGVVLAMLAAVLVLLAIWAHSWFEDGWRTTIAVSVFALAWAQASALSIARLPRNRRWLQTAAWVTILLLASAVSALVFDIADDDGSLKVIAVLAIFAVLESLIIPTLHVMARAAPDLSPETIVLTKREDGTYAGEDGRRYELKECAPPK